MKLFSNPWVIGIGVAVIAGLILSFVFGIGKVKRKHRPDNDAMTIDKKIQQNNSQTAQPSLSIGNGNSNVTIRQNFEQHIVTAPPTLPIDTTKTNILPKEIFEHLESLPPLQRDISAQNYKGLKVSWKVNLRSTFEVLGKHYLILHHENSSYGSIVCEADISNYPQLRIMKEGDTFTIDGTISKVDSYTVNLTDCSFHF